MEKPQIRVRMAPSPTGEYHVGHIRTVLYNLAFARKMDGKFIIRIEDTDRTRFVEGAQGRILKDIKDYGLDWDEGPDAGGEFGPYTQSERLQIYKKYAEELIEKKAAYRCFCTTERLDKMREEQKAKGVPSTKYDRLCLDLSEAEIEEKLRLKESHVIRLKVPENQTITFKDVVFGEISFASSEVDDQVLLKSDGYPTYHLGVVVDDYLMKITHVMRGNDWLPSTPKHILIYQAFGWEIPTFVHLPNLKELGSNKKLSKRFGSVFAREFLDEGYLPEALLNFLMFLGWNPGTEKEIYSLDEFIKDFSVEKIHKTDLVAFDRKKLEWMNGHYIRSLSDEDFLNRIEGFVPKEWDKEKLLELAPLVKERIHKLGEVKDFVSFIFETPSVEKSHMKGEWSDHVKSAYDVIDRLSDWSLETLNSALMTEVKSKEYKTGPFFMSLRLALSGKDVTPPINESIIILGKEETLSRLRKLL